MQNYYINSALFGLPQQQQNGGNTSNNSGNSNLPTPNSNTPTNAIGTNFHQKILQQKTPTTTTATSLFLSGLAAVAAKSRQNSISEELPAPHPIFAAAPPISSTTTGVGYNVLTPSLFFFCKNLNKNFFCNSGDLGSKNQFKSVRPYGLTKQNKNVKPQLKLKLKIH